MENMCLYFVLMLFLCNFMAASSSTTDQSALLEFKVLITSDPQSVLAYNWSISQPVCKWFGISCGAGHGRVTGLNLQSLGLGGTIPPGLGNLSFLENLNLDGNSFHGHLPSELGQLTRLRAFNFNNNSLSGGFPSWNGTVVSKLRVLDLSNNNFTGTIPADLCHNLPILEELGLENNMFSGSIPKSITNCTSLKELNLRRNFFKGEIPQEIGNLQNLQYLYLSINNLTGVIPSRIFNISTIIVLALNENELSGYLPSSIGHRLPNIKQFAVAKNKLEGPIPHSFSNASNLSLLELSHNSFSGLIPNTFGTLGLLEWLNVGQNNLSTESSTAEWSFLSSLKNCSKLRHLSFYSNPLYGVLPPSIGNFSDSLQFFYAYDCKLKGSIPIEIGNLLGLLALSLYYNDLSGPIPTTVGRLQMLQGLDLDGNSLEGSIPDDLCHLEGLYGILLQNNKLSGHIPTCLGNLTNLRQLDLSSNKFTSKIPSSLWTLTYILYVNLSSNFLTDSIPSDIGNLKVLTSLDLSKNQLSGNIPVTIGSLKDLVTLSLADNRFDGSIPESFSALMSLESLDFSNNKLSGEIPKSLVALSYLKYFNVSLNMLEGEIPTGGPFKNFSSRSFRWNYALCGSPRLEVPPCKESTIKRTNTASISILKYILPPVMSTILVTIIIIFIRCRDRSGNSPAHEDLLPLATWRRTSYLEIRQATNGFSECNLLGAGSFGSVYKGMLSDGTNVAIKVFNLQLESAFKSFDSECEILRNIRHRNLIKILSSCCNNIDFKALVLEFIPNGSLEKWLYSHNYLLDVLERLNIMIDVASALEYLHHGHSPPVVHCDLKPSNILLDENLVAHVSDFGISKLLGEGDSMTQTMTLATIGYMAPEYGSTGIVSSKGDVYSYGILLMEAFTRKKPTDETLPAEMSLKQWVKKSLPHALTDVMDGNLLQEENAFTAKIDCVQSIMDLALDCAAELPEQRINMNDVVAKLKRIKMEFLSYFRAT